jgi:hypothetical protein
MFLLGIFNMKKRILTSCILILFSLGVNSEDDQKSKINSDDGIGQEELQELINWECSKENPFRKFNLNCALESTNTKPKE